MPSNEEEAVFRGHIEECVQDYNNRLSEGFSEGSKGSAEARQPLADFCGVSQTSSVYRWLKLGKLPRGAQLIKLMCFLDIIGYKVIDLERMSKTRRMLSELIGFSLATPEELIEEIGYASTSNFFQTLYGHCGVGNDRAEKMWSICKERKVDIEQAKARIKSRIFTQTTLKLGSDQIPIKRSVTSFMEGLLLLLEETFPGNVYNEKTQELLPYAGTIRQLSERMNSLNLLVKELTRQKDQKP